MFRYPPDISSGEGINLYNLGREHRCVAGPGNAYREGDFGQDSPMCPRDPGP